VQQNKKFFRCWGNNIITIVTEKKVSGIVAGNFLMTRVIILLQQLQNH
jgi:hypothetical protein